MRWHYRLVGYYASMYCSLIVLPVVFLVASLATLGKGENALVYKRNGGELT